MDQDTETPIKGYMCLTDWNFELGEAMGGTKVYGSVEDLKFHRKCVGECGIVKVQVSLVEVIQKSKPYDYEGIE